MCGDLSLEKQTSISRTNMNPTTEEILPEKVSPTIQLIIFQFPKPPDGFEIRCKKLRPNETPILRFRVTLLNPHPHSSEKTFQPSIVVLLVGIF